MTKSNQPSLTRRVFLSTTAAAGGAMAASAILPKSQAAAAEKTELKSGSVVLFQGDSITDAGRSRKNTGPNNPAGLGHGYPFLLGGALLADHAKLQLQVYNRGISGNKVPDLAARWQQDALDLKPAVLSILIGVNDIWHKLAGRYNGTVEDYETGYRDLLQNTLKALPEVKLVRHPASFFRYSSGNTRRASLLLKVQSIMALRRFRSRAQVAA